MGSPVQHLSNAADGINVLAGFCTAHEETGRWEDYSYLMGARRIGRGPTLLGAVS